MATQDLTAAKFEETIADNDIVLSTLGLLVRPCRSFAPTFAAFG